MQTYLFSIQPKWCEKIFSGKKTIEVRKTAPKPPFKVVVYCTKRKFSHRKPYLYVNEKKAREGVYNSKNKFSAWSECRETLCINAGSYCEFEAFLTHGKVIGEFICNEVSEYRCKKNKDGASEFTISEKDFKDMAIDGFDLFDYADGKDIYGIHITDLKLYDKPKELGEFYSIKQCKPEYSPFGYQWTWEDRHKRNTGGRKNAYRPVPIECHRCKSLVGGKDYLDEKSGCILFDYECISNYHKPLARPPQSYMRIQDTKEVENG